MHNDFAKDVWSPNIEGKLRYAAWLDKNAATGPFSGDPDTVEFYPYFDQNEEYETGFIFNASNCSAEYVTGASLQPSALQVLACIKA